MSIKRFGTYIVAVWDIPKAKIFYSQVLGLNIEFENSDYFEVYGQDHILLPIGKASIEDGFEPGKNAPINIIVDNIQETRADLESKGVSFLGAIVEFPGKMKLALFEDPDKNKFFLIQELD